MIKWFKKRKRPELSDGDAAEQLAPEVSTEVEEEANEQGSAQPVPTDEPEVETFSEESGAFESLESDDGFPTEEMIEAGAPAQKRRLFSRLRERLHKTRDRLSNRLDRIFRGRKVIDADLLDELEEVLITSDLGVRTTQLLLKGVTEKIERKELSDPAKLRDQLREDIRAILDVDSKPWSIGEQKPFVIMVIGVNGVGKTTTIGKLAHALKAQGLNVMLVAADTFRAAAIEQLTVWGERIGVPVIRQKSGSDPSAVAFDGLDAAASRDVDVLILDTAGRMHTKINLMEELKKLQRVIAKKIDTAPHEVLLVLDATTGQNALSQARQFQEGIGLTGLVLTKLDGTAKGGIVVAICDELKVPIRYIGIGESIDDLRPFDAEEFARALF